MPRNFGGSGSLMSGSGNPFSNSGPGALLVWRRTATVAQQDSRYMQLIVSGSLRSELGTDVTSTSGKTCALQQNSTSNTQALATSAQTANAWELDVAAFSSYPNNQIVYSAGGKKAIKAAISNPGTVTTVQIGGRGTFDLAHAAIMTRIPTDLEVAACGLGFVNLRALGLSNYYYLNTASGTETDQVGSINLSITGTSSTSGDPNMGTWFTGTAIPNQNWTQGVAITNIDLKTEFDNGVATSAPWTGTLCQLGAAGTPTAATAPGTNSTALTTSVALTAGQWVKVGSNALTPVLYVSGNTALLRDSLTWNNADTVTPYPVAALTAITGNGVTVNGSNVTTGTPGAGAVGTYTNCLFQATNNTNTSALTYSNLFTITVASSGAAPSFSSGPTLTTANTDGYTFGATSNQTATWYAVALLRGSPVPTGAQVKSGSPTGFVARVNTALTASVAGALSFTGLTFPFYDVYHVVDNGSGTSAVSSFTSLFKTPPAGKQYVTAAVNTITAISKANPAQITTSAAHGRTTGDWVEVFDVGGMTQVNGAWTQCTVVDSTHITLNGIDSTGYSTFTSGGKFTWGRSSFAGSSTPVLSGDVLVVDATDGQGNSVTFTGEGVAIFATNSTARQSFVKDVYSVSLGNFIGSATEYENDSPPIPPGATTQLPFALFPLNEATSAPIAGLFNDPQGDDLTNGITALTGLPPNRTIVGGMLTGIATSTGITQVTFQAQNKSGESSTFTMNIVDGGVLVPNGKGKNQNDVQTIADSNYLTAQFGTQDDPTPGGPAPQGTIIGQTPPANTLVNPGSLVIFVVSSGNAPTTQVGIPDVSSSPTDQATATATLQAAGFVVVVPQSWTGTQKIVQVPTAGSMVPNGTVVSLFLPGGGIQPKRRISHKKRVLPTQKPLTRILLSTPGRKVKR